MGHIVDRSMSENVKQAFGELKQRLHRNQDAIPIRREFPVGSQSITNPNGGRIRVSEQIRRMLKETFENLGWSDAEFFLQTLGILYRSKISFNSF
jgi:hypothetical protein